jgi:hypothetical protein
MEGIGRFFVEPHKGCRYMWVHEHPCTCMGLKAPSAPESQYSGLEGPKACTEGTPYITQGIRSAPQQADAHLRQALQGHIAEGGLWEELQQDVEQVGLEDVPATGGRPSTQVH